MTIQDHIPLIHKMQYQSVNGLWAYKIMNWFKYYKKFNMLLNLPM